MEPAVTKTTTVVVALRKNFGWPTGCLIQQLAKLSCPALFTYFPQMWGGIRKQALQCAHIQGNPEWLCRKTQITWKELKEWYFFLYSVIIGFFFIMKAIHVSCRKYTKAKRIKCRNSPLILMPRLAILFFFFLHVYIRWYFFQQNFLIQCIAIQAY